MSLKGGIDWGLPDEKIRFLDYGRHIPTEAPPQALPGGQLRATHLQAERVSRMSCYGA